MKNETNDGGPAFPNAKLIEVRCPETGNPQDTYVVPVGGMTLRDYFAAKVLAGMMADPNLPPKMSASGIAETAYCIAGEMLKAREAAQ